MRIHGEVAEALAARTAGGRAGEHDHRPRAAAARQPARRARDRGRGARGAAPCRRRSRSSTARSRVGLDDARSRRSPRATDVAKCGVRDLAVVAARGGSGATTVAATAHLAARAGIRVFATGGLGGVHREARETLGRVGRPRRAGAHGDLRRLRGREVDPRRRARRSSGWRRSNVTVLGYGTDRFPGFYLADSGFPVAVAGRLARGGRGDRARRARELGHRRRDRRGQPAARRRAARPGAARPRARATGWRPPRPRGVRGKDVTPFLLDLFHRETGGATLAVNVRLVLRNAALAARDRRARRRDAVVVARRRDGRRRRRASPGRSRPAATRPAAIALRRRRRGRERRVRGWRAPAAASRWSPASATTRAGRDALAALRGGGRRRARRGRPAAADRHAASCSSSRAASARCCPTRAPTPRSPADLPDELFAAGAHLHVVGLHAAARAGRARRALDALERARAAG